MDADRGAQRQPYLRRGSGWKTRVTAALEGRRYVPRGGPVKVYAPLPGDGAVAALPLARALQHRSHRTSGSSSSSTTRPAPRASPAQSPAKRGAPKPAPPPPPAATPAAASDWSKRLLAGKPSSGGAGWRQATQQAQDVGGALGVAGAAEPNFATMCTKDNPPTHPPPQELLEFEALESQVLREVSNSPPPRQQVSRGRAPASAAAAAKPSVWLEEREQAEEELEAEVMR